LYARPHGFGPRPRLTTIGDCIEHQASELGRYNQFLDEEEIHIAFIDSLENQRTLFCGD
jgi:hypothetical protein